MESLAAFTIKAFCISDVRHINDEHLNTKMAVYDRFTLKMSKYLPGARVRFLITPFSVMIKSMHFPDAWKQTTVRIQGKTLNHRANAYSQ